VILASDYNGLLDILGLGAALFGIGLLAGIWFTASASRLFVKALYGLCLILTGHSLAESVIYTAIPTI
jgi:hypothetical protein